LDKESGSAAAAAADDDDDGGDDDDDGSDLGHCYDVEGDDENEDATATAYATQGPLMERHAEIICSHGPDRAGPDRGGDVLNIGFGLGLVDEAIQVGSDWGSEGEARIPAVAVEGS